MEGTFAESQKESRSIDACFHRAAKQVEREDKLLDWLPEIHRDTAIHMKNKLFETKMKALMYDKCSIECQITDPKESRKFELLFIQTDRVARHMEERFISFLKEFKK